MSWVITMGLLSIIYGFLCLEAQAHGTILQMCMNKSFTTNAYIVLMNERFPDNSLIGTCSCEFRANGSFLELVTGMIRHTNQKDSEALRLRMNNFQSSYALSSDAERIPEKQFQNNALMNISISNNDHFSNISFVLVIRSNITTEFNVTCLASDTDMYSTKSSVTTPTPSSTKTGLLDDVTSPVLVLILSSLCAALLVIILIVSIMLCCVMPRKQKAEITKIRNSMAFIIDDDNRGNGIYHQDAQPSGGDYIRPKSHIYSNAAPTVPWQSAQEYQNQQAASWDTLTVPSYNTGYKNKSGHGKESSFYQNA